MNAADLRAQLTRPCRRCGHTYGDHATDGECLTFDRPPLGGGPGCQCPAFEEAPR